MKHLIIGTAGHVDHGKTRLIGKLTGTNTDRLKEEQARGISIELGFATMNLGDVRAGIVDVPGHEKFVRTMVAGAGGVDLALLVVAADEGVMQQTREHIEVLDLLGVSRAVVALSKLDLVERELAELAAEEVSEFLESTSLAGAPLVLVSSETGEGVEELRETLSSIAAELPERQSGGAYRMPIDRIFSVSGMGTVVTGTTWSGSVSEGEQLEILPSGKPVRVRGIQVHDQACKEARAGQRTALALHGVKHDEVERGEVLASPDSLTSSHMFSLRVQALASNPRALRQRSRIRFHFGTREVLGRLQLLDCDQLEPGAECLAQARLEEAAVGAVGDRVILRFYSPMRTVAGASILESDAPKRRHARSRDLDALALLEKGDPGEILEGQIRETGLEGLRENEALKLADHYGGAETLRELLDKERIRKLGKSYYHENELQQLHSRIGEMARESAEKRPLAWGPSRESLRSSLAPSLPPASFNRILEDFKDRGLLRLRKESLRVDSADPEPDERTLTLLKPLLEEWKNAGLQAPGVERFAEAGFSEDAVPDLLSWLIEQGELIRISQGLLIHCESLDIFRKGLRELFAAAEVLSVGEVGRHLGLSRKISVPLLEYSDLQGWTIRRESERRQGEEL
ncbi:MAG: selenocysteine-specific translation elongation factor [Candidatus Krumholzibacteria bacterium]|nr:selenocysteine-specific translation elongation factor [Candidatus Krumholzibacteria bacterium]MDP6668487.1 selenocysteine-specific translation elongation factor [Candidatus Krumholzibacteria bacterium]MDP7021580.1 selenocysteine-specific translation elongation factor [Candidatus Krumholzibacteria bacterium]